MIQVMLVDDSAVVRQTLSEVLSGEDDITVIETASDPYDAAEKLKRCVPDVMILDIEMPRMDGLTFLKKLMSQHPLPVIICSSKAEEGSSNVFQAMQFGAVDIILKPKVGTKQFIEESRVLITDAVRAAYLATVKKISPVERMVAPKLSADVMLPMPDAAPADRDDRDRRRRRGVDGAAPRRFVSSLSGSPSIARGSSSCSTCPSISPRPSRPGSIASAT